ncbi:MAG: ferritin-like domain-containing protein [Thermomicrobiales bacterium]
MRAIHEEMRSTVTKTGALPVSRRGMLAGGGIALALAGTRLMPAAAQDASPVASPFADEVEVLNYALTLEHLESAFYRDGLAQFDGQAFVDIGFQASVLDYLVAIGEHEAAHVETLTAVITDLGGTPVAEGVYDFGYTDLAGFLQVAAALENTGVYAYTGAAQYLIDNDDLLTAALTIHGVEARHAAYLNVLNATSPFPDAVDAPLTPDEVLEIATPFITG